VQSSGWNKLAVPFQTNCTPASLPGHFFGARAARQRRTPAAGKTLGFTVPLAVLGRADEVIEQTFRNAIIDGGERRFGSKTALWAGEGRVCFTPSRDQVGAVTERRSGPRTASRNAE
jgi:hypothetical protein